MKKTKKNLTLIKGSFTPLDAKAILFSLINSKIHFHSSESFGITIRSGGDTSYHQKRIEELEKTFSKASKLVGMAEKRKQLLDIRGEIEITFTDSKPNARKRK